MPVPSNSPAALVEMICDDIRSTPDEKARAQTLVDSLADGDTATRAEVMARLGAIWADMNGRDHRIAGQRAAERSVHATLAWTNLTEQLVAAKDEWGRVADAQFWLGIFIVPTVIVLATALALWPLAPVDAHDCIFLSLLLAAAVANSFFVLRVHQQARLAQERIVEKRVGLGFLRIALSDYYGDPAFDALVQSGTQMFLGHHAAATIPLGPDDLRAALRPHGSSPEKPDA